MTVPAPPRARRAPAALVAVLAAVALALGLAPTVAGAHGGDGEMTLVSATRGAGDEVDLTVELIYVEDGHGVPDATVTAVVGDSAAVTLAATAAEGQYQGVVEAPAGSTIRVTSVEPVTTLEVPAPVAAATTEAPTTSTTEAPTTTAAPTTEPAPTTTEAPTTDVVVEDDDDGGLSTGVLVAIGAGVVVIAGLGIWAALNLGKGREDEDEPDATGTGTPPPT
ncbi:hypothetical protein PO878_01340 [Iamia majanohamensis]|uniref:Carboxypeptidase regulatory-like domain-containing protein n=1 Tax=Iamia majanohamensis TaxID=467976 RepID=A0AAF0BW25_9ACTN|nr:hypothetical protein [Iamia majanohamensis]WCO67360.1 hypothetical protein PO878_01340 [Iamia majanohamensis]